MAGILCPTHMHHSPQAIGRKDQNAARGWPAARLGLQARPWSGMVREDMAALPSHISCRRAPPKRQPVGSPAASTRPLLRLAHKCFGSCPHMGKEMQQQCPRACLSPGTLPSQRTSCLTLHLSMDATEVQASLAPPGCTPIHPPDRPMPVCTSDSPPPSSCSQPAAPLKGQNNVYRRSRHWAAGGTQGHPLQAAMGHRARAHLCLSSSQRPAARLELWWWSAAPHLLQVALP